LDEKNGYSFNFSEKRLFVKLINPLFWKNRISKKKFAPPAAEEGKRKRVKGKRAKGKRRRVLASKN
jgi:hypothetical protein